MTLHYRWLVFVLAVFYAVYLAATNDYANFAGVFRFLTYWGVLFSVVSAGLMLANCLGKTRQEHAGFALLTATVNALVVFLYWKLYFTDPALVQNNGGIVWWQEYYVHLAGPVLQWIDYLFILGGAQRIWRAVGGLVLTVIAYSCWIELILKPLSARPVGTVTSGLPYPFLNSMEFPARLAFYGSTCGTGFVFLAIFFALGWGVRKWRSALIA